ncbi:MAG: hypothetical protein FJ290_30950, partial [Planctomycetes bacterium]|nr:hypothetical protein [Planctomycetota bacterium]
MDNILFYGDNLDVLERRVASDSVDLVYLDPPFKSNQDYNILFLERNGSKSEAQARAFEDTWHWDSIAAFAFERMVEAGGRVSDAMRAFKTFLGNSDMLAYLAMMAPRLVQLHSVIGVRSLILNYSFHALGARHRVAAAPARTPPATGRTPAAPP